MVKLSDPRLKQMEKAALDENGKLKPGWNWQAGIDDDGDTDVDYNDDYATAIEHGLFRGSREEYEAARERDRLEWMRINDPDSYAEEMRRTK